MFFFSEPEWPAKSSTLLDILLTGITSLIQIFLNDILCVISVIFLHFLMFLLGCSYFLRTLPSRPEVYFERDLAKERERRRREARTPRAPPGEYPVGACEGPSSAKI